eukprot:GILJ01015311.1.p1 GENE.GILJ01015311.1~~GILJ01015311.1.p1  ORF type:complete len:1761 (-),score=280.44 GILJ01015311.1:79-5031(-)
MAEASRNGWTVIHLPLSSKENLFINELSAKLHPLTLLFLRNIKRLELLMPSESNDQIIYSIHEGPKELESAQRLGLTSDCSVLTVRSEKRTDSEAASSSVEGSQDVDPLAVPVVSESQIIVFRRVLVVPESIKVQEPTRKSVQRTELVFAFPVQLLSPEPAADSIQGDPIGGEQMLYSFLPIKSVGLPFSIHADFVLVASRQDLHRDKAWNRWLRDQAVRCLISLILSCNLFKTRISFLLPMFSRVTDDFWRRFVMETVESLRTASCILTQSEQWKSPSEVLLSADSPLLADLLTNEELLLLYGREFVDESFAKNTVEFLESVDVRTFDSNVLCECLRHAEATNTFANKGDAWWQRLFNALLTELDVIGSLSNQLSTSALQFFERLLDTPLFKLGNGTGSDVILPVRQQTNSKAFYPIWHEPPSRIVGWIEQNNVWQEARGVFLLHPRCLEEVELAIRLGVESTCSSGKIVQFIFDLNTDMNWPNPNIVHLDFELLRLIVSVENVPLPFLNRFKTDSDREAICNAFSLQMAIDHTNNRNSETDMIHQLLSDMPFYVHLPCVDGVYRPLHDTCPPTFLGVPLSRFSSELQKARISVVLPFTEQVQNDLYSAMCTELLFLSYGARCDHMTSLLTVDPNSTLIRFVSEHCFTASHLSELFQMSTGLSGTASASLFLALLQLYSDMFVPPVKPFAGLPFLIQTFSGFHLCSETFWWPSWRELIVDSTLLPCVQFEVAPNAAHLVDRLLRLLRVHREPDLNSVLEAIQLLSTANRSMLDTWKQLYSKLLKDCGSKETVGILRQRLITVFVPSRGLVPLAELSWRGLDEQTRRVISRINIMMFWEDPPAKLHLCDHYPCSLQTFFVEMLQIAEQDVPECSMERCIDFLRNISTYSSLEVQNYLTEIRWTYERIDRLLLKSSLSACVKSVVPFPLYSQTAGVFTSTTEGVFIRDDEWLSKLILSLSKFKHIPIRFVDESMIGSVLLKALRLPSLVRFSRISLVTQVSRIGGDVLAFDRKDLKECVKQVLNSLVAECQITSLMSYWKSLLKELNRVLISDGLILDVSLYPGKADLNQGRGLFTREPIPYAYQTGVLYVAINGNEKDETIFSKLCSALTWIACDVNHVLPDESVQVGTLVELHMNKVWENKGVHEPAPLRADDMNNLPKSKSLRSPLGNHVLKPFTLKPVKTVIPDITASRAVGPPESRAGSALSSIPRGGNIQAKEVPIDLSKSVHVVPIHSEQVATAAETVTVPLKKKSKSNDKRETASHSVSTVVAKPLQDPDTVVSEAEIPSSANEERRISEEPIQEVSSSQLPLEDPQLAEWMNVSVSSVLNLRRTESTEVISTVLQRYGADVSKFNHCGFKLIRSELDPTSNGTVSHVTATVDRDVDKDLTDLVGHSAEAFAYLFMSTYFPGFNRGNWKSATSLLFFPTDSDTNRGSYSDRFGFDFEYEDTDCVIQSEPFTYHIEVKGHANTCPPPPVGVDGRSNRLWWYQSEHERQHMISCSTGCSPLHRYVIMLIENVLTPSPRITDLFIFSDSRFKELQFIPRSYLVIRDDPPTSSPISSQPVKTVPEKKPPTCVGLCSKPILELARKKYSELESLQWGHASEPTPAYRFVGRFRGQSSTNDILLFEFPGVQSKLNSVKALTALKQSFSS